jgi:hypothetical protein
VLARHPRCFLSAWQFASGESGVYPRGINHDLPLAASSSGAMSLCIHNEGSGASEKIQPAADFLSVSLTQHNGTCVSAPLEHGQEPVGCAEAP